MASPRPKGAAGLVREYNYLLAESLGIADKLRRESETLTWNDIHDAWQRVDEITLRLVALRRTQTIRRYLKSLPPAEE